MGEEVVVLARFEQAEAEATTDEADPSRVLEEPVGLAVKVGRKVVVADVALEPDRLELVFRVASDVGQVGLDRPAIPVAYVAHEALLVSGGQGFARSSHHALTQLHFVPKLQFLNRIRFLFESLFCLCLQSDNLLSLSDTLRLRALVIYEPQNAGDLTCTTDSDS